MYYHSGLVTVSAYDNSGQEECPGDTNMNPVIASFCSNFKYVNEDLLCSSPVSRLEKFLVLIYYQSNQFAYLQSIDDQIAGAAWKVSL